MTSKSQADEARVEAAAALLEIGAASALLSKIGFVDFTRQLAAAICPAAATTVVAGPLGPHTPNGVGKVRLAGSSSGTGAVGVTGVTLNIETSVDGGVTWVIQQSVICGGIPTGAGLAAVETVGGATEAYLTEAAVPLLVRMTATVTGALAYTTGAAIDGELSWQQF